MRCLLAIVLVTCAWGQADWRVADLNGSQIHYRVIDGEAVWQGDILLGPISTSTKDGRASSVLSGQRFRWTNNTIPYVIDADIPSRERIESAISHWNGNTPMRLVPRQNETNYVNFRRRNGFACSSSVGMLGGRQFINLPDDCELGSVIHEIGHTVGLYHTQARQDRDVYLRINTAGILPDSLDQYDPRFDGTEDTGAYPYDSIMHYSVSGFAVSGDYAMATRPSGIPLGQRTALSASDIDTVIRIQGGQPARSVIASNPSGITVLVDGQFVQTPASFDWPVGSRHLVSVSDTALDGAELRFGRWSDFSSRTHTVIASRETTVFTAHMRRFYPLPVAASPFNGGQVIQRPAREEAGVPDGSNVELEAVPNEGFVFTNWSGFGFFSSHGSANPIRFNLTSPQITYTASFSRASQTTITTSPPGLRIQVDGTLYTSPRRFTWTAGTRHDISVEVTSQTTLSGGATHEFAGWSDGGSRRHTVTADLNGGTITAQFDSQYEVLTATAPSLAGRIVLDPAPVNGFLPAGSLVTVSAQPSNGFGFAGWGGNRPGGAASKTLTVDGILDLQARFAQPGTLTGAGLVNGASFFSGAIAPGQIVTLFGLDLGPAELAGLTLTAQRRVDSIAGGVRVLFDGAPAPILYASSTQVGAVVPFSVAGRSTVLVQLEYNGRRTNGITAFVAPSAPAFFTANSSGRGGGAFLNADGSLNTEDNPAERGSIVVLYATGIGAMRPAMADGELAAPPYPQPALAYKVLIAGRECEILYGGAAPGLVAGLVQLNVRVPEDIGPGSVPVFLQAGDAVSPRTVSLAVR